MKRRAVLSCLLWLGIVATAEGSPLRPLHPDVLLRDVSGTSVLESGDPVSTSRSCGECHDAEWIEAHGLHASLGLDAPDAAPHFDPLVYAWLAPSDTADPRQIQRWLGEIDGRHAGGAFARAVGAELNCFVCHLEQPDDRARRAALADGRSEWAVTATLASTGLTVREDGSWHYLASRFLDGKAPAAALGLTRPRDENCGLCHGRVEGPDHRGFVHFPSAENPRTEATGVIVSPARMRDSSQNLRDKNRLSRPWDVHAARLLECATCHASPNDPLRASVSGSNTPDHLRTDVRSPRLEEFLRRPDHDFGAAPACESCHDAERVHEWLPYRERHLQKLECESCHIPRVHGSARRVTDWSLPTRDGEARVEYRGVDGDPTDPTTLVEGYEPVLLPRADERGEERLAPHNLMAIAYWFDRDAGRPVPMRQLRSALYAEAELHPEIARALDHDGDGRLEGAERRLDRLEKQDAVRARLAAVGAGRVELRSELRAYPLHHGVAPRASATRDCESCHGPASRLAQPFVLAAFLPGDGDPALAGEPGVRLGGQTERLDHGTLVLRPSPEQAGVFLLGSSRRAWVDDVNRWALVLVAVAVFLHGSLRWVLYSARHRARRLRVREETR